MNAPTTTRMPRMVEIKNNASTHKYEAFLDEKKAGVCHYHLDGKTITFTHTVVDPECEGRKWGSRLAKHVLDESRANGLKVVPTCTPQRSPNSVWPQP